MAIFTLPRSFQSNAFSPQNPMASAAISAASSSSSFIAGAPSQHPPFFHLVLLVFEAVLEVVCVSLPGYFAARQGMFDAEAQKLVANLNVTLFTPCLIFIKLGSQLTAETLADLAIIPVIFIVQTVVSYLCAFVIARCFRFKKRQSNFVAAMAVFGNSNSLPISLVMSLSQTLKGLHWDRIPNDNDDEVAARGILYLLIFQQLGQLVRWSWGYHILLAPKDRYLEDAEGEETGQSRIEQGQARYSDNPDQTDPDEPLVRTRSSDDPHRSPGGSSRFHSGDQTPVSTRAYSYTKVSSIHSHDELDQQEDSHAPPSVLGPPPAGPFLPRQNTGVDILSFPDVEATARQSHAADKTFLQRCKSSLRRRGEHIRGAWEKKTDALYGRLPPKAQKVLSTTTRGVSRFLHGAWDFMNPPLWAMLVSVIVASVPSLQHLFFDEGTFIRNSVTRAIDQNAQVAVPLILVVLGANLARNTLSEENLADVEHPSAERKLIIASLVARMLLPTLIMAPLLALMAKFVPISIMDDPIFIIVCFLLTGAPSALQLAQICQINNVYVGAMSKLLFQSYVVWILPSTLILVMCALEVLEWSA
ncbi:Putative Auxin Efflux Carrier superfamily [Penicillium brasilianum]|uniref:Putative Auxin Efflux Carrier superfamily n=1 Tax=Penicillium brasilianum TaxID=104259 RepID=A0A0F7VAZ8_PENBI|nr:Putative Auxin Efflux Carrier superfamily [Penicillium brasilianum]